LSADSDDGIPVPSVSVEQLKEMLQAQKEASIIVNIPSADPAVETDRSFGKTRAIQGTSLADALEDSARSDCTDKENGMMRPTNTARKASRNTSLVDSASFQSSVDDNVETTVLTYDPTESDDEPRDQIQAMPALSGSESIDGKNMNSTDAKNVSFAPFLAVREFSPPSISGSMSEDTDNNPKSSAKKKILKWISKKRSKKTTVKLATLKEEREDVDSKESASTEESPDRSEVPEMAVSYGMPSMGATAVAAKDASDSVSGKTSEFSEDIPIELVAKKTKTGKNAILIANSRATHVSRPRASTKKKGNHQSSNVYANNGHDDRYSSSPSPPTTKSSMEKDAGEPHSIPPVVNEADTMPLRGDGVQTSTISGQESSANVLQHKNSSEKGTNATKVVYTNSPRSIPTKKPSPQTATATTSTGDDWFSWLFGSVTPPTKPVSAADPEVRNPDVTRMSSTGTKNTLESHQTTEESRSIMDTTSYRGDEYTQSTRSTGLSDEEGAVKGSRSRKKNGQTAAPPSTKHDQQEVEQIPEGQWQEILDATETLAMSFSSKRKQQGRLPANVKHNDQTSVSQDSIEDVKRAILKFRSHARMLGVQERELMEAVRDDDRSVPSHKHKQKQQAASRSMSTAAKKGGGYTDK
ncbi:MAG: hypothetical protein SGILL_009511, partial [Bacillariaceae sp.]